MATRFDHWNLAGQCKEENRFEGGKLHEFGNRNRHELRKGTAQRLFNLSKTTKQWEIGELDSSRIPRAR